MSRKRVGVVGGGIFGVTAALALAATCDVLLFEQESFLLRGSTFANHNRHHYGYHYPRSPETARQCLEARESFDEQYGEALIRDFDNYYCVAGSDTKTTPSEYLRFCKTLGLRYEEAWPDDGVLDRTKIALCLRVPEPVYDFEMLRRLVSERLGATPRVTVLTRHRVTGASVSASGAKALEVQTRDGRRTFEVDALVNVTYARYNAVLRWLGFPARRFQFNLQELDVIRLPGVRRLGITVQDGPFPSVLPFGRGDTYLFAHVLASQLVRDVSDSEVGLLSRVPNVVSNWERVLDVSVPYIPILRRAVYVRSIFADRVVEDRSADDARITEITDHGSGCWSVFGAKVVSAVATGHRLRALVDGA